MTEEELQALAAQHGGIRGRTVDPKTATRPASITVNGQRVQVPDLGTEPNPNPDYIVTFADGSEIKVRPTRDEQNQPTGLMDVVDWGNLTPTRPSTNARPEGTLVAGGFQYNPETGRYDIPIGNGQERPLTPAERRAEEREGRIVTAQENANAIAWAAQRAKEADQRLEAKKFELLELTTAWAQEGRLDQKGFDWAKFQYDQVKDERDRAERDLKELREQERYERTQGAAERGQEITQRGQDLEAATSLGTAAQQAALGTFNATVPEGSWEFFNQALKGLGQFYPGGPDAVPQMRIPESIPVPRDLSQVGTRVTSGVLGGQLPILPPRVTAPERVAPQMPQFSAAGPVLPPEEQAEADAAIWQAMEELLNDEGPGPNDEPVGEDRNPWGGSMMASVR